LILELIILFLKKMLYNLYMV